MRPVREVRGSSRPPPHLTRVTKARARRAFVRSSFVPTRPLLQGEGGNQHAAVAGEEQWMPTAVGGDLDADRCAGELRPVPRRVDDEVPGVRAGAQDAAVPGTNDLAETLEDPLVRVEAV